MAKEKLAKKHIIITIIFIILGLCFFFLAAREFYYINITAKNYPQVEATCHKINSYTDQDSTTYNCEYIYSVNQETYFKTSSISSGNKPKLNSTTIIKYNPDNPREAIITSDNKILFLVSLGSFFIFLPLLAILSNYLDKTKKLFNFFLGLTLTIIGACFTTLMYLDNSKNFSLLMIIPLIFLILGLWQIIFTFSTKSSKLKQKIRDNEAKSFRLTAKTTAIATSIQPYLEPIVGIIQNLFGFFIILVISIWSRYYFFFIPLLILLLLSIIKKLLDLIYTLNLKKNYDLALKIANISKLFNIKGMIFYFWSSVLIGIFITYGPFNKLSYNTFIIALILILLIMGIFLDLRKKK